MTNSTSQDVEPPATGVDRIPVFAPWGEDLGPSVSLGTLTAFARVFDDGILNRYFDIARPIPYDEVKARLQQHTGPAILLCSDYRWSLDGNLSLARSLTAANPDIIVFHGGPSAPSRAPEAEAFLRGHGPAASVLVRGEGEESLAESLRELARSGATSIDALADVPGLAYISHDGTFRMTPDRPRQADLGLFPSPFLSGEFDDIDPAAWKYGVFIESNRGCPYGCTFCDWGNATMSRIRHFPFEKTRAEFEWAAKRGIFSITMSDANFGISRRDAELVDALAEIKASYGSPRLFGFCPAKNTTKHLLRIMERLRAAEIDAECTIGIQSSDPATLQAVGRSNISSQQMLNLAGGLRARGMSIACELILGLPGQTLEAFVQDLQFTFDHELESRVHRLLSLANAPMADPEYKASHGLSFGRDGLVTRTQMLSEADLILMSQLVEVHKFADQYGVLRQLCRWLQWDCGIPAMAFLRQLAATTSGQTRYSRLAVVNQSIRPVGAPPPADWTPFFEELRTFLHTELGITPSSALETTLRVQQHILPSQGRSFPSTIQLQHDFVGYARSAGWGLLGCGSIDGPVQPLQDYGPGELTVHSDPVCLGSGGRLDAAGECGPYTYDTFELVSPLSSPTSFYRTWRSGDRQGRLALDRYRARLQPDAEPPAPVVAVQLIPVRAR